MQSEAVKEAIRRIKEGFTDMGFCLNRGSSAIQADLEIIIEATQQRASTDKIALEVQEYKADRFKEAYDVEREKFQKETLRTSEYARLLRRILSRLHDLGCRAESWAKSCVTCDLMVEAEALLERPLQSTQSPARAVEVMTVEEVVSVYHYRNKDYLPNRQGEMTIFLRWLGDKYPNGLKIVKSPEGV